MISGADQSIAESLAKLAFWTEATGNDPIANAPIEIKEAFDTASRVLGGLTEGSKDPWTGARIHKIVRKSARFIVFLDNELNVQWWWITQPNLPLIATVQARINELTHESAFLLEDRPSRKERSVSAGTDLPHTAEAQSIRSVIAEAMALTLCNGTAEQVHALLNEAEQYIVIAKDQRCRPRFVGSFAACVLIFGAAAAMRFFGWLGDDLQKNGFVEGWMEAMVAGALGAMVSALTRTEKLQLEPAAKMWGLFIEAAARACIGAAAGVLVFFAYRGGLIMNSAIQSNYQYVIGLFLSFAAGLSERILPALVDRAEGLTTGETRLTPADKAKVGSLGTGNGSAVPQVSH